MKIVDVASIRAKAKSIVTSKFAFDDSPIVVGCILLYLFLLIENPIEAVIPGLNYFDEAIFIGSCIFACVALGRKREHLDGRLSIVLFLSLSVVLIGVIGNYINDYQRNVLAIVSEAVAYLKFPLTMVAFSVLLRHIDREAVVGGCALASKIFLSIAFAFCIVNFIIPSAGFGHDIRNGIMSYKFVYTHPTFLALSLVMAFAILEAQNSGPSTWKVLCLFLMAMTMRDKALAFDALIIFVWVFRLHEKKRLFKYFLLAGCAVLLVVSQKIALYISFSSSPREALYSTSAHIAVNSFPFGGGLASIASSLSCRYYSNAYYEFGISDMDGLTPVHYYDAGDAGIPYYLGQFGFIGLILTVIVVVLIVLYLSDFCPVGSAYRSSLISLIGYIIIAITVETVLTNASGLMLAILLVYIAGPRGKDADRESCCNQRERFS